MAKKSSIEKNNRRKRMTKNAAPAAREAEGDHRRQDQADGRAVRRDAEARRDAAQFVGDPDPQPLRTDRPSALESIARTSFPASRCVNSAPRAWFPGS